MANHGVVQIRVTPKTRNPFVIKALSISGVTWKWHFLNHAGLSARNKLSQLLWDRHDAIIAACKKVWQFLVNDPERIQSIRNREWACVRG